MGESVDFSDNKKAEGDPSAFVRLSWSLLDALEGFLDGLEVGELTRVVVYFGVLHHALAIDDKGGPLGHSAHGEIFFGQEALIGHAIRVGGFVLVVAEKLDADSFLFGPRGLRERIVSAHADHLSAELFILVEALRDAAELFGADTGERHGDEEEDRLLACGLLGEGHQFRAFGAESSECKIRGGVAYVDSHGPDSRQELRVVNPCGSFECETGRNLRSCGKITLNVKIT